MGTNRPYAAFGSRPVSPRRRSCSGASSATATLGGNAPICRHSSATGLSSSHRPCTRSACKVGSTPITLAMSCARRPRST